MGRCDECDKRFGHEKWCPSTVKGVILERRRPLQAVPAYTIPIEDLRNELGRADLPQNKKKPSFRPSEYHDFSREYPPKFRREGLHEFPYSPGMKHFDYKHQTNKSGGRHESHPDYKEELDVGYGRIIASDSARFRGYSSHPIDDRKRLDRSPEIRQSRFPGLEKVVRYEKQGNGKPVTVGRAPAGVIMRSPHDYV